MGNSSISDEHVFFVALHFTTRVQEKTGGCHGVVVSAVSKVAFNQAVDSVRAGGTVVAVGLPSEYMELSIVKAVLDGIRIVGSLVGTRKDLEEAFAFGAQGLVVPIVEKYQ